MAQGITVESAEGKLGTFGPDLMKIAEIIGDTKKLSIQQSVSALEAITQGAYEAANKYKIYAADEETGMPLDGSDPILLAQAYGPCIERQCCAPFHSLVLKIYDPVTGTAHLSLERKGVCSGKYLMPCCCACSEDLCNDGVIIHEGDIEFEQGSCGGITVTTEGQAISKILQSSSMTPQLDVYAEVDSESPYATITGPCCFGGCSELCCSSNFAYDKGDTPIASMKKRAPSTCGECCVEACTDADTFNVTFEDGIEAEEKANSLAAVFLTDYMFFEQDNGMVTCVPGGGLKFTCFQCYFFGCLIPCSGQCKQEPGEGEDGGAPATTTSDATLDRKPSRTPTAALELTDVKAQSLDRSV